VLPNPWDSLATEIRAQYTRPAKKNICLLLSYTLKIKQNHFLQSSSVEIDVNCPVRVVSSEQLLDFFL
jgi:hypothetical protein